MLRIATKCVWSPIDSGKDGLRILATRYIPRGCPKERYDVWMANLGPSEVLLKAFKAEQITWKEFAASYKQQLFQESAGDEENPRIKNKGQKFTLRLLQHLTKDQPITLLCHCAEDEPHCHRHLLQSLLMKAV